MIARYKRYRSYGHGRIIAAMNAVDIVPLFVVCGIIGGIVGWNINNWFGI